MKIYKFLILLPITICWIDSDAQILGINAKCDSSYRVDTLIKGVDRQIYYYDENDKLFKTIIYKNNKLYSIYEGCNGATMNAFYYDESDIISKSSYVDSIGNGTTIYYYLSGQLERIKIYYVNQLKTTTYLYDITFHENGKLLCEYKPNVEIQELTLFDSTGHIYKKGKLYNGHVYFEKWEELYNDGTLKSIGKYWKANSEYIEQNNITNVELVAIKDGKWKYYAPNGELILIEWFERGALTKSKPKKNYWKYKLNDELKS